MTKAKELAKAKARGQELTQAEEDLEAARERWHKKRGDQDARRAFREAQRAVRAERRAAREQREAEGAPQGADVVRDATGRVSGWTIGGDAVAMPGGAEG